MIDRTGKLRRDMVGGNNYFAKNPPSKEQCSLASKGSKTYNNGKVEKKFWPNDVIENEFKLGRLTNVRSTEKIVEPKKKEFYANGGIHPRGMLGKKVWNKGVFV